MDKHHILHVAYLHNNSMHVYTVYNNIVQYKHHNIYIMSYLCQRLAVMSVDYSFAIENSL